jgi:thiamine monophosphate synthase
MQNAREVVLAGADAICAISATVGTDDVAARVREFEALVRSAKAGRGRDGGATA